MWTAADVADIPDIEFRMTEIGGLKPYRQPVLARHFVRYVGEPVAVVFATDPYIAEDAADLVLVDIEPMDVALDPTIADVFLPDLPAEAALIEKGYGDVDAAFAAADAIVALELGVGRHTGVCEPRAGEW